MQLPQNPERKRIVRMVSVLAVVRLLGWALTGWLFWSVAPSLAQAGSGVRASSAHTQSELDSLVASGIAGVLAGGDYGEVQEMLERFGNAGFFSSALVVNASGRVVAAVGNIAGVRTGDSVADQLWRQGRRADILLDTRKRGELLILATPANAVETVNALIAGLRAASMLVLALTLLAAAALAWYWWRLRGLGRTMPAAAAARPGADGATAGQAPMRQAPHGDLAAAAQADDDGMAKLIYANQLNRIGKREEAIRQLELAQAAGVADPNLQYIMGLAYFEVGVFDKSVDFAHLAYRNGYTLPGLKNKLVAAGHWREPLHAPVAHGVAQ